MKYIFVFLTFVISLNSIAQSKKEQIAILTARLDSLNKEYVKDTTYLSNTVETGDREYTIISMQYDEAQEQLKKKSATITDKSNTIKSLNVKNMDLMAESKKLYQKIQELESEIKSFKSASENPAYLFTLSQSNIDIGLWDNVYIDDKSSWNSDFPNTVFNAKYEPSIDIGLNYNGKVLILESNLKGAVRNCDLSSIDDQVFDEPSGYVCDSILTIYFGSNMTHLYILKKSLNQIDIIEVIDGDYNMPLYIYSINERDTGQLRKTLKCEAKFFIDEQTISCISGDCNYKNYLKEVIFDLFEMDVSD